MTCRVRPGHSTYGHSIGIVMQHDGLIRSPGDVGNLTTFSFPVTYAIVDPIPDSVLKSPQLVDFADPFVEAAQSLEKAGCKAISSGCGFLALLQQTLAESVGVPVFSSALIQVPLVSATLAKGKKVGIITASSSNLSEEHFLAVGWSSNHYPIAIIGIEEDDGDGSFSRQNLMEIGSRPELIPQLEASMRRLAMKLVENDPLVGAIVLECTNMPPFAQAIQDEVGLPVFDIVTLINMVHESVTRTPYRGHY